MFHYFISENMSSEANKMIEKRKQALEEVFLAYPSVNVEDANFRFSQVTSVNAGLHCPSGWVNNGYKCGMFVLSS